MKIEVTKLTDINLIHEACSATIDGKQSNISLDKMYKCMHSPIRTQIFFIKMIDIPSFVSVHFVRHKIGVEHFVSTRRDDRTDFSNEEVNRLTPVKHYMLINAESLINMARKRLCFSASKETREVFGMIKKEIEKVDPELAKYLVPECYFRNGYCPELKSCGLYKQFEKK